MKRNTWSWMMVSGLSIFLLSSGLACASAPGSTPAAQPPQVEQTEKKPAQFEVSTLTVKPATVMVGYPATVTATVINSGDIAGSYTVSLLIDGQEIDSREVLVDPGAYKEVSFQVTRTTAGSYKLMVGNSTAKLTVCAWTPQTIQYDSGIHSFEFWATYIPGGGGHIVHFTPLTKPFKVQKVSISAHTRVANYADLHKRMFTVRIWNEDKTQLLWSDDFSWDLFETMGWQDVDVPDIISDGDFHVEVVTNSDGPPGNNALALCFEESKDESRSGISFMGQVVAPGNYFASDKRWFIRVSGQGPPETCVPEGDYAKLEEEATSEPEAEVIISSPKLVYEDDFSDSSSWYVESNENHDWFYEDGEYRVLIKSANLASWQVIPSFEVLTDLILEADARLVSGPKDSHYGLGFRVQNTDNFYLFLVSGNGYYYVGKRINDQWAALKSWTKSAYIETGNSTNHLKVVCKGSKIAVYVNGHHLTTITDKSFNHGRVGVIVDTTEPNANFAFDNLKVYRPD